MEISNIAIIGCGYWGTIITKNLRLITNGKIFVYDKSPKNISIINKKFKNIEKISSINEICKNSKIKNVFLVTPPTENFKILKKLIISKKNIFVEKPYLTKLKNGKTIERLLKKYKNIFMCGYVYLFNQNILKIKEILKKKILGNILFVKSLRENLGPIRTDVDCNYDLASHDLSIMSFLFGKNLKIKKVIKHKILNKKNTDTSSIEISYKKTNIEIRTSWLNPEKIRKIIIIGSQKMLLFNEIENNNEIKILDQYAKYPEIKKLGKIIFSKKPKIYSGNYKIIKVKNKSPVLSEIEHFLSCLKSRKQAITDVKFSNNIIKLLEIANKN
jgi:predicted dehydrogenase